MVSVHISSGLLTLLTLLMKKKETGEIRHKLKVIVQKVVLFCEKLVNFIKIFNKLLNLN
jgi:hypothetical protein